MFVKNWSKFYFHFSWFVPLFLYSSDACAWGLFTHAYFAQILLWGIPITDKRFRNAIKKFPELLLAGACLPDLSMFGKKAGTTAFEVTHRWESAKHLLDTAKTGEEHAMALGYCSHLFVDIIAHNHFVPAHEKMWGEYHLVTHAICEWAMDAHISPHLFHFPDRLLLKHRKVLSIYAADRFGTEEAAAIKSLNYLAYGVRALRVGGITHLCYRGAKAVDSRLDKRFNYYMRETGTRLSQINRILEGEAPAWHAELHCKDVERETRERIRSFAQHELLHKVPLPLNLFQSEPIFSAIPGQTPAAS
ncbi:MAG: zinc dependent phospholipase C family protein [Burkholderiales bacterium]|nr:zinc dependent phospholipase C family protein [Burkholderiales bacterium]